MAEDGLRMYVVGAGALDISDDGGESWRACSAEFGFPGSPPAIALHPQDSDTLLLGQWGSGIFKTTDGCGSWTEISAGLDNLFINALSFDLSNPDVIYAGTDGGAFISLDGGDSWNVINAGLGSYPIVYSIAVDPADPAQVYAATPDGIFRLVGAPPEAAAAPTPIPGSPADQARAFAEPILTAIANRAPDYEDDFSDPGSGWDIGTGIRPVGGEAGYVEGEYFVRDAPGETCYGGSNPNIVLSDFVLEIDVRWASTGNADWQIQFRETLPNRDHTYNLIARYPIISLVSFLEVVPTPEGGKDTELATHSGSPMRGGYETNHIQIVARGPEFAIYANGEPMFYATDGDYSAHYQTGSVTLEVCNQDDVPIEARWDNFRIWDISDLELPSAEATPSPMADQAHAFAEPILAAVADRPPDFEDDFSTADKEWWVSFGMHGEDGSFAIEDGVARFRVGVADMFIKHEAMTRKDFVLQVDARLITGDMASEMSVNFHNFDGGHWNAKLCSGPRTWELKGETAQSENLASGVGNVSPLGETTQIIIVARGPRAAVYLNGAPVAYFEDADFDTAGKTLLFCRSFSQSVCEFDNVKFWSLENVPGLP